MQGDAVADPGFAVGGDANLVKGDANCRCGYVLKILYAEMKELRPLGGARRVRPLGSANEMQGKLKLFTNTRYKSPTLMLLR